MDTNETKSGTTETKSNLVQIENDYKESPFCQTNCKVCNSIYRLEIFDMLKSGITYREISQILKDKYNSDISISCISRHQKNYKRAVRALVQRQEYESFNLTAETVGKHQKQTLFLMDASFRAILQHLEAGTLVLGIDEFEKLTKLYYNVVRDPDSSNNDDVVALFQKAAGKKGFDIHQGVLFKPKRAQAE